MDSIIFFTTLVTTFISLVGLSYFGLSYLKQSRLKYTIKLLSSINSDAIIDLDKINYIDVETNTFERKLHQAGIDIKEYKEAKLLLYVIGVLIGLVLPIFIPFWIGLIGIIIGASVIGFAGEIYLTIAKQERVERINKDLGLFLELVNIILEAGGGIKNAIFQVAAKSEGIICNDLISELYILQVEMNSYPITVAYKNFKNRIGSKEVDKVIDFLILSEGTGIGVKEIFAREAEELQKAKSYEVRAKVKVINLYLLLAVFIFILPAIVAFIAFPIASGKFNLGL